MTKEISTEIGNFAISYLMTERDGQFGILVRNETTGEAAAAPDISPDREAVESMLALVAEGEVTPTTLMDVIEDYLAAI